MKHFSRFIKVLCLCVVFGVIAFLIGRIVIADYYPDSVSRLYASPALRAAYAVNPALQIKSQKLRVSYDDPKDSKFMANCMYYCPEAGEVQIAIRYNESALAKIQNAFSLSSRPAASPDLFDFSLTDEYGNRYAATYVKGDDAYMYHYQKVVFSSVDFSVNPGYLRVEIYLAGHVDYDETPYAVIAVYEQAITENDTLYQIKTGELQ